MIRALAMLVLCAGGAAPANAQCRLALILGLDISSSVNAAEDNLQRQGLARALLAPEVAAAALSGPSERIALAVFEWSGRDQQNLLLDWTDLRSRADLEAAAQTIAASRRSYAEFPTAIGHALGFAADKLRQRDDCPFRTVDLSGDGINNDGIGPQVIYKRDPLFDGVTVNGLIIAGDHRELLPHYLTTVLHGAGAFLEIADGFSDFERAMTRKLLREMGTRIVGAAQ